MNSFFTNPIPPKSGTIKWGLKKQNCKCQLQVNIHLKFMANYVIYRDFNRKVFKRWDFVENLVKHKLTYGDLPISISSDGQRIFY